MNKILETTKLIVDDSVFVKINKNRIVDFVEDFRFAVGSHWLDGLDVDFSSLNLEQRLNIILFFDALVFSYWGDPKWTIEYAGREHDGSYAMIMSIKRALEEGYQIFDWGYCENISREDFAHIFRGNVEIPLFEERLNIIREIGSVIIQKFDGRFSNLLERANNDVETALELIMNNFPSFEDVSFYKDDEIYFLKRAQILVDDIHRLFPDLGYTQFKNIGKLTACADYKLPQILRKFGVLEYRDDLCHMIDSRTEIEHDSIEELEIRANTIWAVEYIKEELLNSRDIEINSIDIGGQLWLATQEKKGDDKPYHLTRTIYY